jgi:hypothetical protein
LQPGTHRVRLLTPSGALAGVELTTHAVNAPNEASEVLIVLSPPEHTAAARVGHAEERSDGPRK